MIIVIGCNKGGAGKTTTATNIAVGLALKGQDICLVDADRQRSAARWQQDRETAGHIPKITLIEKLDNLSETLKTLSGKFEHVLVDVAGHNSREMITGAMVADVLLAPHQSSQMDLDTLEELQEQTQRITDLNPALKILVYQAISSPNPSVKEAERNDFLEYVGQFEKFVPLKSIGYYRKVYRDVIPKGQSVLEGDNLQAKTEMNTLIQEIFNDGSEYT